jgi:hypothetical protein
VKKNSKSAIKARTPRRPSPEIQRWKDRLAEATRRHAAFRNDLYFDLVDRVEKLTEELAEARAELARLARDMPRTVKDARTGLYKLKPAPSTYF